MKFVWNSPHSTLDMCLGRKLCGITRGRQRPDQVYFTIAEVHEIFESKWDYFVKQVMHTTKQTVKDCLK